MTEWLSLLSAIAGTGTVVAKSGYFVKTGEIGALTTFGAVKRGKNGKIKLLSPGFKVVIPFAQTIIKAHTRKNTDNFQELFITLSNGISYKFNAYIVYHVMSDADSVENVLFSLDNYKEFIKITFEKAIQQSLEGLTEIDNTAINERLTSLIKPTLIAQGIEVDDCGLISFTATEQSQQLLGLRYKIEVAKSYKMNPGIMAAILGATPTVVTNAPKAKEVETESDSWF